MKFKADKYFTFLFYILSITFIITGCSKSRYRNIARNSVCHPSRIILLDGSKPIIQYDGSKNNNLVEPFLEKEYEITKNIKKDSLIVTPDKIKPVNSANNYNAAAQTIRFNDSTQVNLKAENKKAEQLINIGYVFILATCVCVLLAMISIIPIELFFVLYFLLSLGGLASSVIAYVKVKLFKLEIKDKKKLRVAITFNLFLIFLPILIIVLLQFL